MHNADEAQAHFAAHPEWSIILETQPIVKLTGADGNAFMILGLCLRAARRANWPQERIDEVQREMMAGDYDHLLQTAMLYFDVR